jgi:hypothetical protein
MLTRRGFATTVNCTRRNLYGRVAWAKRRMLTHDDKNPRVSHSRKCDDAVALHEARRCEPKAEHF